jgi:hypothetical protein
MFLIEDRLMHIETDKLVEQYTLKVPEVLKVGLSSLSPEQRKNLNLRLMVEMAKAIHESRFIPEQYLTTRDEL